MVVIVLLCSGIAFIASREPLTQIGTWVLALQIDRRASDDASTVRFVVNRGETAAAVADRLEREKLISSALLFRMMAKLRDADSTIEAGEYQLRRNMTVNEVIDELQQNRFAGSKITIVEGWRAAEIADLLQKRGIAKRAEFMALVDGAGFEADFLRGRPLGASLEGYLFPDTYRVPPDIAATEIVQEMLKNFGQRFNQTMREQAAKSGLSIHEVVTIASIIEREAVVSEERPIIASVYLNRLKSGMRLDADPTVQYAVAGTNAGEGMGDYWKKDLTVADLQVDSPYNTYRYTGLPPGPIANPGLASIKAVIEPATTDYLYFVASGNGSHVFARTLEEHNQNVVKYRR